jgi:putative FmdB family regulatory protein
VPTYQYACTACGDRLEVVQKFSDDPLTDCEACGGRLRKLFSPVGIVFKGSGFYRTDSRSSAVANGSKDKDKQPSTAASGSPPAGEKSGGSEQGPASSDAKPAKKAEPASNGKSASAGAKVA